MDKFTFAIGTCGEKIIVMIRKIESLKIKLIDTFRNQSIWYSGFGCCQQKLNADFNALVIEFFV